MKEVALKIVELLEQEYPEALCSLEYEKDYELLFATRLAAQCTDERVNKVTPTLYSRYPSLEALAEAKLEDVEEIIRSCGFFHTKARDIIAASQMLLLDFGGVVPDNMEDLLKLPGVGRKTANIILGDIYRKPAVVTDTHCIRLANRMGLAVGKEPYKVEMQLAELIPPEKQSDFCHRLVLHGRAVCSARKPTCDVCVLHDVCAKKL
ncbi:MAG: endonuclease III [Oscillospiraceae bacterium]|nr:endonuclease III [Oscillospiraceae bacterium]